MAMPLNKNRDFRLIWLINDCGIVFQWNVRDVVQPDTLLYSFRFFWRQLDPRVWWMFEWTDWHGSAKLRYSHGRKYQQRSGWTINGPLVKFTAEHL